MQINKVKLNFVYKTYNNESDCTKWNAIINRTAVLANAASDVSRSLTQPSISYWPGFDSSHLSAWFSPGRWCVQTSSLRSVAVADVPRRKWSGPFVPWWLCSASYWRQPRLFARAPGTRAPVVDRRQRVRDGPWLTCIAPVGARFAGGGGGALMAVSDSSPNWPRSASSRPFRTLL